NRGPPGPRGRCGAGGGSSPPACRVGGGGDGGRGRVHCPVPHREERGRALRLVDRLGFDRVGGSPVPVGPDRSGGGVHDGRGHDNSMNPIIRRELLELLRTRKAVAAQVGLAAACALLMMVRWPTGGVSDLSGARSLQVLHVFGYGLL